MSKRCQAALWCLFALISCSITHAQVPWNVYHKTEDIVNFFQSAAVEQPNRVRLEQQVDQVTNVNLPVVTITDFASGEAGKEVLLIVAGEHGRELITSDIVYWLGKALSGKAEELLHWPTIQNVISKIQSGIKQKSLELWLESLLQKCVFKIVPVANVEGRKRVESGMLCQRTTPSGVDLNRNWPYAWKIEDVSNEEYGGAKPLSEPQTRIIKDVAVSTNPRAFVNLHSGEYALYVPWDSQAAQAPNLPADIEQVLDKLNVFCQCMHGSGGKVAGYLAYGTSMDYLYQELQVPYPLTIEVYGPGGTGKLATGGKPRHLLSSSIGDSQLRERWHRPQGSSRSLKQQVSTQQQMAAQQAAEQQQLPQQVVGAGTIQQQQEELSQQLPQQAAGARQGAIATRITELAQQQASAANSAAANEAVLAQGAALDQKLGQSSNTARDGAQNSVQDKQENLEKCFRDYNPASSEGYQDVVSTWLAALLTLAEHLASNPEASLLKNDAEQQQLPIPPVPPFKQDLAAMAGTDSEESLSQDTGLADFRSKATRSKKMQTDGVRASMGLSETTPAASSLLRRLLLLGGLGLLIAGVWMKMGSPLFRTVSRRTRSMRRSSRSTV